MGICTLILILVMVPAAAEKMLEHMLFGAYISRHFDLFVANIISDTLNHPSALLFSM